MSVQTVGILSPGEMGAGVGAALQASGLSVLTCLAGRSPASHERARAAGIEDVPDLAALAGRCDLILSILVPAHARGVAVAVGDAARASGATTVLADCNAIAPQTVKAIATDLDGSGVTLVDGGIVGGPPRNGQGPRVYASGTAALLELARVLSTYALPEDLTIYFVAFGAEEDGLRGSRYFVNRLDAQQRQSFVAMLNYDMIGVGDVLGVGGSSELTELAARLAAQQGWTAQLLGEEIEHRSDHAPFAAAGIRALVFHAPNDRHYHKKTDTPDRIQPGHLARFGRLGLAVVQRLVVE